jgi:hypothetical protein
MQTECQDSDDTSLGLMYPNLSRSADHECDPVPHVDLGSWILVEVLSYLE